MKIVFFATYYKPYLVSFETKYNFKGLSYKQIYDLLIDDYFGTFGLYAINANSLGCDAYVVVANFKPLQLQWAIENNVPFNENDWMFSIAFEQIKRICPDVFFTGSIFEYYGEFLDKIKPYCKILSAWTSCPIPKGINHQKFRLVLTSLPYLCEHFRKNDGVVSEILLPGFSPNIFNNLQSIITQNIDFSFIGGISSAHIARIDALRYLSSKTKIDLFGYGYPKKRKFEIIKQYLRPNGYFWNYKGEAWGLEMFLALGNSKITFNSHIDMAQDNAVNMRMFEATGMGTLLLTDHKTGIENVFIPDKEIVTYKTLDEAIQKVAYYLNNDTERDQIAKAGQARTFADYNLLTITKRMIALFEQYL